MDVVQVCVCVRVCNQLGTAVGQQQVGFYYVFFLKYNCDNRLIL